MTFANYILCGIRDTMPNVVRITSAGCERRHAVQATLYRRPEEKDDTFLYRTLALALRLNIKLDEYDPFSPMLGGVIVFDYDAYSSPAGLQ